MDSETRLRGVLLDVDGTLVDSNDAHAAAWHKALQQYGHTVLKEAIDDWIGKGGDQLLPELTGVSATSEEGRAISSLRKKIFEDQYLPKLEAFPCARELVAKLRDSGLLVGVATSATRSEVQALLELADVLDLVELVTSADDADRSKPAPDILEVALEAMRLEPEQAILIGDTPYDVEAGQRAGVRVVAVGSGGWRRRELLGCIAFYEGIGEIYETFDGSPFTKPVPARRYGRRRAAGAGAPR